MLKTDGHSAGAGVNDAGRLLSLDATRGLALLGIMLVNVHYFTGPMAAFYLTAPDPSGGWVPAWLDEGAFFFSRALFEGKFFPLYSLLFGAGMVLIFEKAQREGRSFTAVYLRRLLVLAIIGLCHGFLLWYGDILFAYSVFGLGLLALGPRCSSRVLIIVGGCLVSVGIMLSLGMVALFMLLGADMQPQGKPLSDSLLAMPPGDRLLEAFKQGALHGPTETGWQQIEREVYTQGPYSQALIVRGVSYVSAWFMTLLLMGATIGGMFLLGAGLMKERFWSGSWTRQHSLMLKVGLGVGLPLCCGTVLMARLSPSSTGSLWLLLSLTLGPVLTLGIAAGVIAWVRSGKASWLARTIAVPGRMGLTNYLLTTVMMTLICYHYGLALWGKFGSTSQVALCLLVYVVLVGFSHLWLSRFSVGPAEWLWSTLSYLRPARLARQPRTGQ